MSSVDSSSMPFKDFLEQHGIKISVSNGKCSLTTPKDVQKIDAAMEGFWKKFANYMIAVLEKEKITTMSISDNNGAFLESLFGALIADRHSILIEHLTHIMLIDCIDVCGWFRCLMIVIEHAPSLRSIDFTGTDFQCLTKKDYIPPVELAQEYLKELVDTVKGRSNLSIILTRTNVTEKMVASVCDVLPSTISLVV